MKWLDDKKLARINRARDWSRKQLRPYRDHRYLSVEQYAGHRYSSDMLDRRGLSKTPATPVNLVAMFVDTYANELVARNPRVLCTTTERGLKPMAADFELAMNELIQEIYLEDVLRQAVRESMLSPLGIVRVGKSLDQELEIDGQDYGIGSAYACVVTLDDWVCDMAATRWDELCYTGHRYRVPFQAVLDSKVLKNTDMLKPSHKTTIDEDGTERVESIGLDDEGEQDEYQDFLELEDLYLPRERLLITQASSQRGKVLREQEWDGPECGPYLYLFYSEVPGNLMPLSPVANLLSLHLLCNRLYTKIARQSVNQKTVLGYHGHQADDATRILNASDRELVRKDSATPIEQYVFPGADSTTMATFLQAKDMFSWFAGNLDVLAGLATQSSTVGQDAMLNASANKRTGNMQRRVIDFVRSVCKSLAWYEWSEPLKERSLVHRGYGMEAESLWATETRQGDFPQYKIEIEPFSMQYLSPSARVQTLMQIVQQVIGPFAPMIQQQGGTLDFKALIGLVAKYMNIDELNDVLVFQGAPEQQPDGPGAERTRKPPVTQRNYTRRSVSEATPQGKDRTMMESLMAGGGVQQKELMKMGRPT